jgi:hypothetical protein
LADLGSVLGRWQIIGQEVAFAVDQLLGTLMRKYRTWQAVVRNGITRTMFGGMAVNVTLARYVLALSTTICAGCRCRCARPTSPVSWLAGSTASI